VTKEAEKGPGGFRPLVPEVGVDPAALHRHGLEMLTAANRLALTWLREAAAQHAAMTRRALDEMLENARRLAAAEGGAEQTRAMIDALGRAQASGLATAQEITALMRRIQDDSMTLLDETLSRGAARDDGTPPPR
jgi:hypothetical protein